MLSSDFLFPRFFVVPLANPSNFSHCKCFSSAYLFIGGGGGGGGVWSQGGYSPCVLYDTLHGTIGTIIIIQ